MEIIKTRAALAERLAGLRSAGASVGLVPTMGALHAGHASLVARSVGENDATVVSVFVNPTQFNDPRDLESYPRSEAADAALLERMGADIAFMPSVEEMYPEPDERKFSFPPIDTVMEGRYRPGHFNGVCQIVSKLLCAVEPRRAYFGKKDFQQVAVVRAMAKSLGLAVEICACPIVREPDGLALSSRNALLLPAERAHAAEIWRALAASRDYAAEGHSVEDTRRFVERRVEAVEGLSVQYFEIVDGYSLQPVSGWDADSGYVVGCITVFCGHLPVRLIDNVEYVVPAAEADAPRKNS